jgi:hypothetical protein
VYEIVVSIKTVILPVVKCISCSLYEFYCSDSVSFAIFCTYVYTVDINVLSWGTVSFK